MSQTSALLREINQEAATTRRVLERVPTDKPDMEAAREIDDDRGPRAASGERARRRIAEWGLVDSLEFPGGANGRNRRRPRRFSPRTTRV